MSEAGRRFSDEELTAFLDGEATDTLAASIAADLARDAELAARLEALDIPMLAVQSAFTGQLSDAPAMPPLPAVQNATPSTRTWRPAALGLSVGLAAGIALAIGIGFQTRAPDPAPMSWRAAVASYQALYTKDTLTAGEIPDPSQLAALSEQISLDLTGLAHVDGLEFRRAQALGFNGKPLIQVAYTLPDGTPFAICLLASDTPTDTPRFEELRGMQAAGWHTGHHGVLIIGGSDPAVLQALAPKIQALL